MTTQNRLDSRIVVRRRHDDTTCTGDGLDDHGSDIFSAFPFYGVFQFANEAVAESGFGLTFLPVLIIVRGFNANDTDRVQWYIKSGMGCSQASEAAGRN